ncbi:MAG: HEAT repeat domain-containing protein [Gemmatimonadales bacterium]
MIDLLGVRLWGPARDSLLASLVLVMALLFAVTAVFSAYVLVLRLRHEARDRRRARYVAKWQEPLLLALSDEAEAAALQGVIAPEERIHFVGFAVQYARRLRGDGRVALAHLVKPFLEPVLERAESRRIEVRARAIQTLGTLGLPDHAPRLIAALDDPSPLVAMVAARALATEEVPEYAQAVLARLHRFTGWNQRFLASMLAAMGPGVAPTLRNGFADPSGEPRSRAVLAEALRIQGDLEAGDVAAEVLRTATEENLLASTLRLLQDIGRPEHADAVRAHVRAQHPAVRAQALHALGAVGGRDDLPWLLEGLRDESPWAALSAARGVLAAGGPEVLTEIAAAGDGVGVLARQVLAGETR